jgi:hypothetical protein
MDGLRQYTPCNNYISGVKISGYFAVPNAVDLDPAVDIQSTSKALFTRSEIAVGVAFDAVLLMIKV